MRSAPTSILAAIPGIATRMLVEKQQGCWWKEQPGCWWKRNQDAGGIATRMLVD